MNAIANSGTGNPVPARRPLARDAVWAPEHRPLSGNAHRRPELSIGSVPGSVRSTQHTANWTGVAGPGCPSYVLVHPQLRWDGAGV